MKTNDTIKAVVFGGQYGSEGKGSFSEHLAKSAGSNLVVIGDNAPNSGHTCSKGKTRQIPAASFYAQTVCLSPDAVVDPATLLEDLIAIKESTGKIPAVIIHEHAAFMKPFHGKDEADARLKERIGSTVSGSGQARHTKQYYRIDDSVVGYADNIRRLLAVCQDIEIVTTNTWINMMEMFKYRPVIVECSQGTLLDVNFGRFPYVTSRTTLPRAMVARNGIDLIEGLKYCGVYRTYPIRTGGNSGNTGGRETSFEEIGVKQEIATVTKRVRRIFEFSSDDFYQSFSLTRPDMIAFTHLDYIKAGVGSVDGEATFRQWASERQLTGLINQIPTFISDSTGNFIQI